jgi:hypothetical protein
MPMLHAHATCPCCMFLLVIHATSTCRMSTLHVRAACVCCMSMLHVQTSFEWGFTLRYFSFHISLGIPHHEIFVYTLLLLLYISLALPNCVHTI